MLEDHFGFLWFGTEDGLNRYDGYNFRVFRNVPGDTNSLSDNNIWSLFEDREGNLWIGTQDGVLNCFNFESERFKHFSTVSNDPVSGNSITYVFTGIRRISSGSEHTKEDFTGLISKKELLTSGRRIRKMNHH